MESRTEFQVFTNIFSILNSIFIFMYLGMIFKDNSEIKKDDWKRKWIIFFAWFGLVSSAFVAIGLLSSIIYFKPHIPELKWYLLGSCLIITVLILNYIFTLEYLGWSFNDNSEIKKDDWKRKWIIFFAWLNLIISTISFRYKHEIIPLSKFPKKYNKYI